MEDRSLQITFLQAINKSTFIADISAMLDGQEKNLIDIEPWPVSGYYILPEVSFSIAHSKDHVYIKYDVKENEVLARYKQINDPVYKDSCVEFFIAFDDDKNYYNIEFNRLGTCLGRFGADRENRTPLPVEILQTIRYDRSLKQMTNTSEQVINWTLTVAVPVKVFCFHKINSIQHRKSKMNFFKCGDDLSQPHYLAWNNIESPEPDFHQPAFFGKAEFM